MGLTDGAFAIVITLLVLPLLDVASFEHMHECGLTEIFHKSESLMFCYLISFVLSAKYWMKHHAIMRYAKKCDTTLLWLNLALVFIVSLVPVATALAGYPKHPTQYLSPDRKLLALTMLYKGVAILGGLTLAAMWWRICTHEALVAKPIAQREVRYYMLSCLSVPAVFLVSAVVSCVSLAAGLVLWLVATVIDIPLALLYPPQSRSPDEAAA